MGNGEAKEYRQLNGYEERASAVMYPPYAEEQAPEGGIMEN